MAIQPPMISLSEVSRNFKHIEAVSNLSLEIQPGELFGLVGPDGAGKTTTLRMIAGLLSLSGGTGEVAGLDLQSAYEKIKQKIGYMAQRFSLYAELNVVENMRFFAELYSVPLNQIQERMDWLLEFANLSKFRDRRADRLSGGMQKKLALACCLIHEPEILILDEPTTGVDPISRREFWNILSDLHLSGTTIVVSTPYMDEADRCSRVGLMYEGTLMRCASPKEIRSSLGAEMVVLIPDQPGGIVNLLYSIPGVMEVQTYGDAFHILVSNAKKVTQNIRKVFRREKRGYRELRVSQPRMEEAFISLMTRDAQ